MITPRNWRDHGPSPREEAARSSSPGAARCRRRCASPPAGTRSSFNLGEPDDYRIPAAGLLPGPAGVWHDTAVLVVEVLSPDDMTFDKLDFYTARGARELLVVDWQERTVRCFALQDAQAEREESEVLEMSTAEVAAAIDWPPPEG